MGVEGTRGKRDSETGRHRGRNGRKPERDTQRHRQRNGLRCKPGKRLGVGGKVVFFWRDKGTETWSHRERENLRPT